MDKNVSLCLHGKTDVLGHFHSARHRVKRKSIQQGQRNVTELSVLSDCRAFAGLVFPAIRTQLELGSIP